MSMTTKRTLHTIVFKEGDAFIASGVELDIFAQGATKEEAERRLELVLRAEMDEARASGRDLFDLGPAPDGIQSLFRESSTDIIAQDERRVA